MRWGLSLSGGAVLGAEHLGVLRALAEWGLAPGTVAGTSAGGLVAGVLAAGASLEAVIAYGERVCARPLEYFHPKALSLVAELLPHDPLPPADGLFDPGAFVAGLVALCPPPRRIEAWRLPAALTTVDVATMQAVAFVHGGAGRMPRGDWRVIAACDLHTALAATMAMPGMFSPVRGPGEVLVDGGVADDLPVDWAVALGAARVVAVDVSAASPGIPPRAGLGWVLGRSEAYATKTLSALRRPPRVPVLTLAPHSPATSLFALSDFGRLVQAGYDAATARRPEIAAFVAGQDSPPPARNRPGGHR